MRRKHDGNSSAADVQCPAPVCVCLWDPALRLFHWALAVCFMTSYLLGEFGPAIMTWHFWSGYTISALLGFRLIWGILGPAPARFGHFLAGPCSIARYAAVMGRREPSYWPGHNPLGGWSVVLMLALLAAQVATGLISDPEDYINVGPLAHLVDISVSRTATAWHGIISTLLLVLVGLHIAVVLFYRYWKHEDLIGPMLHGRKWVWRR